MISLIAVIGKNRELGKDNKLLWHLSQDLAHFKQITLNHPVIMGRKTFESLGRPLPNRINIVISRAFNPAWPLDLIWAKSLPGAIEKAQAIDNQEIFVIGGGQIYAQAINMADKLYLTIVDHEAAADTFFPDYSNFKKVVSQESGEENGIRYEFLELVKQR